MIEVEVTVRAPRILRGGRLTPHQEAWEARSADGLWYFERLDDTGTPWLVTTSLAPRWSAMYGTLKRAQEGAERQFAWDFCLGWIEAMR